MSREDKCVWHKCTNVAPTHAAIQYKYNLVSDPAPLFHVQLNFSGKPED